MTPEVIVSVGSAAAATIALFSAIVSARTRRSRRSTESKSGSNDEPLRVQWSAIGEFSLTLLIDIGLVLAALGMHYGLMWVFAAIEPKPTPLLWILSQVVKFAIVVPAVIILLFDIAKRFVYVWRGPASSSKA